MRPFQNILGTFRKCARKSTGALGGYHNLTGDWVL